MHHIWYFSSLEPLIFFHIFLEPLVNGLQHHSCNNFPFCKKQHLFSRAHYSVSPHGDRHVAQPTKAEGSLGFNNLNEDGVCLFSLLATGQCIQKCWAWRASAGNTSYSAIACVSYLERGKGRWSLVSMEMPSSQSGTLIGKSHHGLLSFKLIC